MKKNYPSKKEITVALKELKKAPISRVMPEGTSGVERLKYELCEQFVLYKNKHRLTQRQMAHQIGIDEALMSKILHYSIQSFTIDRLLGYLLKILPKTRVELSAA